MLQFVGTYSRTCSQLGIYFSHTDKASWQLEGSPVTRAPMMSPAGADLGRGCIFIPDFGSLCG